MLTPHQLRTRLFPASSRSREIERLDEARVNLGLEFPLVLDTVVGPGQVVHRVGSACAPDASFRGEGQVIARLVPPIPVRDHVTRTMEELRSSRCCDCVGGAGLELWEGLTPTHPWVQVYPTYRRVRATCTQLLEQPQKADPRWCSAFAAAREALARDLVRAREDEVIRGLSAILALTEQVRDCLDAALSASCDQVLVSLSRSSAGSWTGCDVVAALGVAGPGGWVWRCDRTVAATLACGSLAAGLSARGAQIHEGVEELSAPLVEAAIGLWSLDEGFDDALEHARSALALRTS